jgi:hypothetical protein
MTTTPPVRIDTRVEIPRPQVTVVPVLGVHRSGTSMFTRALNLLGLDLGEPIMKPQPDNPKGFWENEFFYDVDLRLLHAMTCHVSGYGTVSQLLRIPALSYQVERTGDNLAVIENFVTQQFSSSAFWGWKDPRSVLLFPFWLSGLVELGFRQIRPAIITRHPASVVRSMAQRADLAALASSVGCSGEDLALQIWIAYSHALLDVVEQTESFVSAHEWYLDQDSARAELTRCVDYLGMPTCESDMTAALQWLDPRAVHHSDHEFLGNLAGASDALLLHEDLMAHARAQRARWRLLAAA